MPIRSLLGDAMGQAGGIGLRAGVRWAIRVLGLLAALSPEPSLVHHDLRTLCPPGYRAALRGAPPSVCRSCAAQSRATGAHLAAATRAARMAGAAAMIRGRLEEDDPLQAETEFIALWNAGTKSPPSPSAWASPRGRCRVVRIACSSAG